MVGNDLAVDEVATSCPSHQLEAGHHVGAEPLRDAAQPPDPGRNQGPPLAAGGLRVVLLPDDVEHLVPHEQGRPHRPGLHGVAADVGLLSGNGHHPEGGADG